MCEYEGCRFTNTCEWCLMALNKFGETVILCALCVSDMKQIDTKKEFREELDMDWDFE